MRSGFRVLGRSTILAALVALAACQPATVAPPVQVAGAPPAPVNGVGYVIFSAPIRPQSRDLLIGDIGKLIDAGARSIHLAMNSPGGEIDAAQGIVDYMARVHASDGVNFEVYNIGLVASAASYVFLTAQRRYANPNSAFLFHAAGLASNGLVPAEKLREEADKLDAYERVVRATMKSRTRLTDSEAQTYVRRTVLLNADDARRDGVIDAIAPFSLPQGARAWTIATRPAPNASRPAPPPPPN
jgi:ATP-dependent protease ClpP protease subunit